MKEIIVYADGDLVPDNAIYLHTKDVEQVNHSNSFESDAIERMHYTMTVHYFLVPVEVKREPPAPRPNNMSIIKRGF